MSDTAFTLAPSSQENSLLATLPVEILLQICESLSEHHMSKQNFAINWKFDSRRESKIEDYTDVLSRLSRTCQRLHGIANPTLYHSFTGTKSNALISYFQTLLRRPGLGKQVKAISFGAYMRALAPSKELTGFSASSLDESLPKGWLTPYHGYFVHNFSSRNNDTKEDLFDYLLCDHGTSGLNFRHIFLAHLLLELTLNVEHLAIGDVPKDGLGEFMRDSSTLESLKSLEVVSNYTSFGTTEKIHHLLRRAPNLERISLRRFYVFPDPYKLPESLQCISLVGCRLTLGMFGNITSSCQQLRKFEYQMPSMVTGPVMGWKQLVEELKHYRKTLEHLTLCQLPRFPGRRQDHPRISFKEFTALKHLWVDRPFLLPRRESPPSFRMSKALQEFLPVSIVSLTTDNFSAQYFDDLAELKRSISNNTFPSLERLDIGFWRDKISRDEYISFQKHLTERFAASGHFVAEDGGFQYREEGSDYRWVWKISQEYEGGIYYRLKD